MFIAGFTAIKGMDWERKRGRNRERARTRERKRGGEGEVAQGGDCLGSNKAILIHIHPYGYGGLFMTHPV